MNAGLALRAVMAALMIGVGVTILVRLGPFVRSDGFAVLPGLVLGAAMIGLGAHRMSLILRLRRSP